MGCNQVESRKTRNQNDPIKGSRKLPSSNMSLKASLPQVNNPNKVEDSKLRENPSQNNKLMESVVEIKEQKNKNILIVVPIEGKAPWEKEYQREAQISNILNDYKEDNKIEIPLEHVMILKRSKSGLPINLSDNISTLVNKEETSLQITAEIVHEMLDLDPLEGPFSPSPEIVGKPFLPSPGFHVYTFQPSLNSFYVQQYEPEIVSQMNLNNFSFSSAYCNGNDFLFISGGEYIKDKEEDNINNNNGSGIIIEDIKHNDPTNVVEEGNDKFWVIDLKNKKINNPLTMPGKKLNHSMIFIPKKYVMIVGGTDKKSFCFNCETNNFFEWAELKIKRIEPALIKVSNFLYCFDNVNKNNNNKFNFEKTDLLSFSPSWELIIPDLSLSIASSKEGLINQKFFGVSSDLDNNIVFLGGNYDDESEMKTEKDELNNNNEGKLRCFKYLINEKLIEESDIIYKKVNLKEKTFLSFGNKNKEIDYVLPDFSPQHPEVLFFIKKRKEIKIQSYRSNKEIPKLDVGLSFETKKTGNFHQGGNRDGGLGDENFDNNMLNTGNQNSGNNALSYNKVKFNFNMPKIMENAQEKNEFNSNS